MRPEHEALVRNPIDAFLLARLERAGLGFAPEADRTTLLRRVSFDLTGLPPTPAEIDAYLNDEKPGAYERLVGRLLDSPRYGERWGQHWLDAAGYSESDGGDGFDPVRSEFHHYRDYVIRALNSDKPYNRFLLEQLAGDELEDYLHAKEFTPALADNLIATGFLRTCVDPTDRPVHNFPPDRAQVLADTVQVVDSTLLGLTLGCAAATATSTTRSATKTTTRSPPSSPPPTRRSTGGFRSSGCSSWATRPSAMPRRRRTTRSIARSPPSRPRSRRSPRRSNPVSTRRSSTSSPRRSGATSRSPSSSRSQNGARSRNT